jgi:membrane protease YdiL (CAAX protease family)
MELQSATPAVHRLFMNERELRCGWRLVIFAAIFLVIAACLLAVIGFLIGVPSRQTSAGSPLLLGLGVMAQFSAAAISSWIMSLIERRPAAVYGLPIAKPALARFAEGYLIWGFLPLTLILLIMRGFGVFYFGGLAIQGFQILYWAAAWGVMFLFVALFEEYLFRGYALYTLAQGIGFWPAAIVLGVGFAAVHLGNGGEGRLGIVDVFIFAIFAAATLRRTGSLWLAVGAHAGWDWGESFFYGVNNSGYQAPGHLFNSHIQGPEWLSGGSIGPEGSVVDLIFWVLMTLGVLLFYRPRAQLLPIKPAVRGDNTPIVPSL